MAFRGRITSRRPRIGLGGNKGNRLFSLNKQSVFSSEGLSWNNVTDFLTNTPIFVPEKEKKIKPQVSEQSPHEISNSKGNDSLKNRFYPSDLKYSDRSSSRDSRSRSRSRHRTRSKSRRRTRSRSGRRSRSKSTHRTRSKSTTRSLSMFRDRSVSRRRERSVSRRRDRSVSRRRDRSISRRRSRSVSRRRSRSVSRRRSRSISRRNSRSRSRHRSRSRISRKNEKYSDNSSPENDRGRLLPLSSSPSRDYQHDNEKNRVSSIADVTPSGISCDFKRRPLYPLSTESLRITVGNDHYTEKNDLKASAQVPVLEDNLSNFSKVKKKYKKYDSSDSQEGSRDSSRSWSREKEVSKSSHSKKESSKHKRGKNKSHKSRKETKKKGKNHVDCKNSPSRQSADVRSSISSQYINQSSNKISLCLADVEPKIKNANPKLNLPNQKGSFIKHVPFSSKSDPTVIPGLDSVNDVDDEEAFLYGNDLEETFKTKNETDFGNKFTKNDNPFSSYEIHNVSSQPSSIIENVAASKSQAAKKELENILQVIGFGVPQEAIERLKQKTELLDEANRIKKSKIKEIKSTDFKSKDGKTSGNRWEPTLPYEVNDPISSYHGNSKSLVTQKMSNDPTWSQPSVLTSNYYSKNLTSDQDGKYSQDNAPSYYWPHNPLEYSNYSYSSQSSYDPSPSVVASYDCSKSENAQSSFQRNNLRDIPLQSFSESKEERKLPVCVAEKEDGSKHESPFPQKPEFSKKNSLAEKVLSSESDKIQAKNLSPESYLLLLENKKTECSVLVANLEKELDHLRKQQGELMRKKRKQKDGHKDPLILEITLLQDEITRKLKDSQESIDDVKSAIKDLSNGHSNFRSALTIKRLLVEISSKQAKEEKNDDTVYEYFDSGNYWCHSCNEKASSLIEMLDHLQSSQHKQTLDPYFRPWKKDQIKIRPKCQGKTNIYVAPIKGVEFMIPVAAFYCQLCHEFSGDSNNAWDHLKTADHHKKYLKFIEENHFYERRTNLEKAIGLIMRKEKGKRKHRENEENVDKKLKKQKKIECETESLSKNKIEKASAKSEAAKINKYESEKSNVYDTSEKNKKTDKDEKNIQLNEANNKEDDTLGFGKFSWKKGNPSPCEELVENKDEVKTSSKISIKLTGKTFNPNYAPWQPVIKKLLVNKPILKKTTFPLRKLKVEKPVILDKPSSKKEILSPEISQAEIDAAFNGKKTNIQILNSSQRKTDISHLSPNLIINRDQSHVNIYDISLPQSNNTDTNNSNILLSSHNNITGDNTKQVAQIISSPIKTHQFSEVVKLSNSSVISNQANSDSNNHSFNLQKQISPSMVNKYSTDKVGRNPLLPTPQSLEYQSVNYKTYNQPFYNYYHPNSLGMVNYYFNQPIIQPQYLPPDNQIINISNISNDDYAGEVPGTKAITLPTFGKKEIHSLPGIIKKFSSNKTESSKMGNNSNISINKNIKIKELFEKDDFAVVGITSKIVNAGTELDAKVLTEEKDTVSDSKSEELVEKISYVSTIDLPDDQMLSKIAEDKVDVKMQIEEKYTISDKQEIIAQPSQLSHVNISQTISNEAYPISISLNTEEINVISSPINMKSNLILDKKIKKSKCNDNVRMVSEALGDCSVSLINQIEIDNLDSESNKNNEDSISKRTEKMKKIEIAKKVKNEESKCATKVLPKTKLTITEKKITDNLQIKADINNDINLTKLNTISSCNITNFNSEVIVEKDQKYSKGTCVTSSSNDLLLETSKVNKNNSEIGRVLETHKELNKTTYNSESKRSPNEKETNEKVSNLDCQIQFYNESEINLNIKSSDITKSTSHSILSERQKASNTYHSESYDIDSLNKSLNILDSKVKQSVHEKQNVLQKDSENKTNASIEYSETLSCSLQDKKSDNLHKLEMKNVKSGCRSDDNSDNDIIEASNLSENESTFSINLNNLTGTTESQPFTDEDECIFKSLEENLSRYEIGNRTLAVEKHNDELGRDSSMNMEQFADNNSSYDQVENKILVSEECKIVADEHEGTSEIMNEKEILDYLIEDEVVNKDISIKEHNLCHTAIVSKLDFLTVVDNNQKLVPENSSLSDNEIGSLPITLFQSSYPAVIDIKEKKDRIIANDEMRERSEDIKESTSKIFEKTSIKNNKIDTKTDLPIESSLKLETCQKSLNDDQNLIISAIKFEGKTTNSPKSYLIEHFEETVMKNCADSSTNFITNVFSLEDVDDPNN